MNCCCIRERYEGAGRVGDVPNVVSPYSALHDRSSGLAVYCGAADTVTALAFGYVDELVDFATARSLAA